MDFFEASLKLLEGFGTTVLLFALTLMLAVPLGVIIAALLKSKQLVIRRIMEVFVLIIRGTPLMLQLIVIFYMPGLWFNRPSSSRFGAVLTAFVINYACYFSVIFKGAYEGIPKGQVEAGMALGLTRLQIFFRIMLMQCVKRAAAPSSNEVITLIKDTALARIISVAELLKAAEQIQSMYGVLWPVFYAGLFYLLFNGVVTLIFRWADKKMEYIKV